MSEFERAEVEAAFRHYFLTGPVGEDWTAWSQLFTDDAIYFDHFYGRFRGSAEIQRFLESTMGFAPHVYSPLVWYNIDGSQIVYKVVNRADNPEPGGEPFEFPSLQVIQYAGDGKWSSEEDWWIMKDMKRFNEGYQEASRRHDPDHSQKMSRLDWGDWVDWARPEPGHVPAPSWLGRDDIVFFTNIREMDFGERV
jgi:ketosteroid isomerase-like protein